MIHKCIKKEAVGRNGKNTMKPPHLQDTGDFSFGNIVQAVFTKYLTLSDSLIISPLTYMTLTTG